MCATPKTSSPSATWGPSETVCSSLGALAFFGGWIGGIHLFFDNVLDGFVKCGPLNVIQMSSSPSTHQTYKNSVKNLSDSIQVHMYTSVRTILKFFVVLRTWVSRVDLLLTTTTMCWQTFKVARDKSGVEICINRYKYRLYSLLFSCLHDEFV